MSVIGSMLLPGVSGRVNVGVSVGVSVSGGVSVTVSVGVWCQ